VSIDRKKIEPGVLDMLRVNMAVKAGERLTVVSDYPTPAQWRELEAAHLEAMAGRTVLAKLVAEIAAGAYPDLEVELVAFPSVGQSGAEPPPDVAQVMREAGVLLLITSFSLTHTEARREACDAGARVASMPRFLPEMFYPGGAMTADYHEIHTRTWKIASEITRAETATVRCPAGTDITFSVKGRHGRADTGIYTEPRAWGNLPAGEAYTAPVEGTGAGRVVVQRGWWGGLDEDMALTFEAGQVVSVEGGGRKGRDLRGLLSPGTTGDPYASRRNLAELGVGTNPKATRTDITLEAEKIMGTVHLAIGDGSHMGGKVVADLHEDLVIPRATLLLDGRALMDDGELLV